jgi:hypothetical protein
MTMRKEIVEGNWIYIDGINGVTIYPEEHFGNIKTAIDDYGYEGITSIEIRYGYAGRLTMPGYLDSTEWAGVFTDADLCSQALDELYPEE